MLIQTENEQLAIPFRCDIQKKENANTQIIRR